MKKIEKNYIGKSLEEVYSELVKIAVENKEHCSFEFNGIEIDTTMSLDDVFIKVIGKDYTTFQEDNKKWLEDYQRQEMEWRENKNDEAKKFIEVAKEYIDESKLGEFERIANIRFSDIYHGFEMYGFLEIVKLWKSGKSMEECKKLFNNQGHSGRTAGIVSNLVSMFCDEELGRYVYN